uniref:Uncharacterized protein n=1 Tax=Siphoviridae sp. ctDo63 TaxID=2823571 RepID=A0A8S5LGK3_9CAUD|nr:MAG TPA: hypothetical protein [Siphoviridae sp. ctDo63]
MSLDDSYSSYKQDAKNRNLTATKTATSSKNRSN